MVKGLHGSGKAAAQNQNLIRVSADKLEARVCRHLDAILNTSEKTGALKSITRLIVGPDDVQILLPLTDAAFRKSPAEIGVTIEPDSVHTDQLRVTLPIVFGKKERAATISSVTRGPTARDEKLIRALVRVNAMIERDHFGLPIIAAPPTTPYERRLIRLTFLQPDLQRDLLLGRQPRGMTLAALLKTPPPLLW